MAVVPWDENINFSSALLLHSCLTIILKEALNIFTLIIRLYPLLTLNHDKVNSTQRIRATFVLDAYTSIFSLDADGAQAELYFTNTGFVLLTISLSASVAMNLLLPDLVLNMFVAGTFVLCFLVSLSVGEMHVTLPIMALRRAGRFIWSDTPFVNFFTLIYIATVLEGQSILRLRDFVTFRSVAVVELMFMKAKLAACSPDAQEEMMQNLIRSERVLVSSSQQFLVSRLPYVHRHAVVAFQTVQRLGVMLFKTCPGYDGGCLLGPNGPCRCRIPAPGKSLVDEGNGLKVCRVNDHTLVLVDCFHSQVPEGLWSRFLMHSHGILLRRIGRVRVVFAIKSDETSSETLWFHSNINLVTGVPIIWLEKFSEDEAVAECIIG